MSPRTPSAARGQSGFVLIGVIIFVLALTIIGLSLYSLSGFEAAFLERSLDGEQAFQSALGGIERAKFALTTSLSLQSVKENLPPDVTSTVAIQDKAGIPDSLGAVDWNHVPVTIRVTARVPVARLDPSDPGYVERTVEGVFDPGYRRNPYSQVISTTGGITVDLQPGASPPRSVRLIGDVWDASGEDPDTWLSQLDPPRPGVIQDSSLTLPDCARFISDRLVLAPPAVTTVSCYSDSEYVLDTGPAADVGYFLSPRPDPTGTYSFWSGGPLGPSVDTKPLVTVHGLAVWLFPQGVRFEYGVRIQGSGSGQDCLVIVAGPNAFPPGTPETDPTVGIRFFGGLLAEIPVILVSNGCVAVRHDGNPDGTIDLCAGTSSSGTLQGFCIYSRTVSLLGPKRRMVLDRQPGGPLDQALGRLVARGALPTVTTLNDHVLALRPGTWRAWPH